MEKWVYGFGGGDAEGSGEQGTLLGGKGAGLAEMSLLGIPVPPGLTVTTEACKRYLRSGQTFPDGLQEQVRSHVAELETQLGQEFGSDRQPLLVSVRSGAPISMPGMMDTVLNLGLNDAVIAAHPEGSEAVFYRDCYRRLLAMYGDVVLGVPVGLIDGVLASARRRHGVDRELDLSIGAYDELIAELKGVLADQGVAVPLSCPPVTDWLTPLASVLA